MKIIIQFFLLAIFLTTTAQTELQKVKVGLHWQPQAQFAGYYIGLEKGIYEKYGLDVEIIHASPSITSQAMLLNDDVDFATMFLSTAMFLKSDNIPIVNVCQLSQRSAQLLVTKDKDIKKPKDINGKKVGIWRSGFDELLKAFVKKYELDIEYVPINSTINLFIFGGIDLLTVMWYNEYHSILNAGVNEDELNTFFFADYGLDIPEDGIYVIDNKVDDETIANFRKATLEAWEAAFKNREEAIELVKKRMIEKHVPYNASHQNWMLNRMYDLFNVDSKDYQPGELLKSDFENALEIFIAIGSIDKPLKYREFYHGEK